MKQFSAVMALMGLLSGGALHAESGEALFDARCAGCHIKVKPTPKMRQSLIAPPAMGVMLHVKEAFPGDKGAATAFIREYVFNPSREKAKCMPQAIRRFGVMPSQKGAISASELALVADYLYENFPPEGFRPGRP
jgi:mono/diheme cytochrome c family protein